MIKTAFYWPGVKNKKVCLLFSHVRAISVTLQSNRWSIRCSIFLKICNLKKWRKYWQTFKENYMFRTNVCPQLVLFIPMTTQETRTNLSNCQWYEYFLAFLLGRANFFSLFIFALAHVNYMTIGISLFSLSKILVFDLFEKRLHSDRRPCKTNQKPWSTNHIAAATLNKYNCSI